MDLLSTDTLSFSAYFDPGSISAAEICTFLDHLESALNFMINHPKSLVCDVELSNDQEMQVLLSTEMDGRLEKSNQSWACDGDLDSIQNVSELIKLQVEKTPQKIAVSRS